MKEQAGFNSEYYASEYDSEEGEESAEPKQKGNSDSSTDSEGDHLTPEQIFRRRDRKHVAQRSALDVILPMVFAWIQSDFLNKVDRPH